MSLYVTNEKLNSFAEMWKVLELYCFIEFIIGRYFFIEEVSGRRLMTLLRRSMRDDSQ